VYSIDRCQLYTEVMDSSQVRSPSLSIEEHLNSLSGAQSVNLTEIFSVVWTRVVTS